MRTRVFLATFLFVSQTHAWDPEYDMDPFESQDDVLEKESFEEINQG